MKKTCINDDDDPQIPLSVFLLACLAMLVFLAFIAGIMIVVNSI